MDRPPHYEDAAWQRNYHRNQREDIATWSSIVHYLTKTNFPESRIMTLTWLSIFVLTIFICISAIRIHIGLQYNEMIILKNPIGVFIMGFSFVVLVVSAPISSNT